MKKDNCKLYKEQKHTIYEIQNAKIGRASCRERV